MSRENDEACVIVARVERSETRVRPAPDFAPLNPGYAPFLQRAGMTAKRDR